MILIVMIGGNLMKFEILSEDEYNKFFDNHEQKTFLFTKRFFN